MRPASSNRLAVIRVRGFESSWAASQVGAASAATAAQYTGAAVMLAMMVRRGLLLPEQAGRLPSAGQWGDTLKPGVPFAFCIAAVVTALLTATNLATGARWPHACLRACGSEKAAPCMIFVTCPGPRPVLRTLPAHAWTSESVTCGTLLVLRVSVQT